MLPSSFPIRTPRLVLRLYRRGDLAFLHSMFGREDVCRFLSFMPMDLDQARAKLEERVRQTHLDADSDTLVVVAEQGDTGRPIGEFMLRLKSLGSRQGEIGWSLHPDAQGRGYATEAAREMLRVGFDELFLHRIVAGCDSRNTASLRVMQRLGMRHEAEFIDHEHFKGEWVSEIVCAMLESEWRAQA